MQGVEPTKCFYFDQFQSTYPTHYLNRFLHCNMAGKKYLSKKSGTGPNNKANQQQLQNPAVKGQDQIKSTLIEETPPANLSTTQPISTPLKQIPDKTNKANLPIQVAPSSDTSLSTSVPTASTDHKLPKYSKKFLSQGKNSETKADAEQSLDLPALFKDEKLRPNPPVDEDFGLNLMFNPKNVPDMDKIQGNYGLHNLFRNEEVYLATHNEELKNRWVFWFQSPSASWGKSMKRLYTVSSFQEVQDILGKMAAPGRINARAEMYVFKHGIRPDRLDNRNQKGGCWAAFLPVAMPDGKPLLNSWFEAVVYNITTGQIPHYKDIVGVKVAIRNIDPKANTGTASKDRLEVWTKAALNQDKQLEIGQFLKNFLKYNGNLRLTYMKHQDVVHKTVKAAPTPGQNAGRRQAARFSNKQANRRPQRSQKKDLPLQSIKSMALYRL
eukprot:TRINITY_DN2922_c0_g2_i1.p1 TRINITY_DN2922_c0_g2~~TRINITY_DN2922_c0_g2_i1.p1  ORF type:complete len:439 (-),score=59.90 TRINITY_DN2922_c0_g2_i1:1071-2387(-)